MFSHKCRETNHRYEARYDSNKSKIEVQNAPIAHLEILVRGDYIHDICVRCGNVIYKHSHLRDKK